MTTFRICTSIIIAPYEPAALKRLMGRYATRENEVDNLLRAEVFVDLYSVVATRHQGQRRKLFDQEARAALLIRTRQSPCTTSARRWRGRRRASRWATRPRFPEQDKARVKGYNRDDCASTLALQEWLEAVRSELVAEGTTIDRQPAESSRAKRGFDDWQQRVAALVDRLMAGVPDDATERTAEQQARWLLAFLLDWHGREKKAVWWEYFQAARSCRPKICCASAQGSRG